MTYIGTFGDMDPNRQSRQMQQFGSAMEFALESGNRKKKEKEAERDREIQRLITMAERYPDAAANYGETLVSKYGTEAPFLRGVVDSIKNKDEIRKTAESAGQKWIQGVEQREAPLRQMAADPGMWQQPGMDAQLGGPMAAATGQQMAQLAEGRIRQVPGEVASELPFDQRLAARVWAKSQGYDFPPAPTTFDPYQDLPQSARAETAAATGEWDIPQAAEVAAIASGREPSASAELNAEIRREEGKRAEARLELDKEKKELSDRKQALAERKERRIAKEGSATGGTATKKTAKEAADWLVDDTELLADEWEVGLKEAASANRKGNVTPDLRKEYEATAGPQPKPLLKSQANLLARAAAEDLRASGAEPTEVDIQAAVEKLQRAYVSLITGDPQTGRKPMTREKAVLFLLGKD